MSSLEDGDSIAWMERYAGRAQPMRLDTGEARPNMLKKINTTELKRSAFLIGKKEETHDAASARTP